MLLRPRDLEAGQPALPRAEYIAFATQAQILLGNAEAVFCLAQDGQSLWRFPKRACRAADT